MKTKYKHINFEDVSHLFINRKTKTFDCYSNSLDELGTVKWYSPWRQYCFFTMVSDIDRTIFSAGCLHDIIDFINHLHAERRMQKEQISQDRIAELIHNQTLMKANQNAKEKKR